MLDQLRYDRTARHQIHQADPLHPDHAPRDPVREQRSFVQQDHGSATTAAWSVAVPDATSNRSETAIASLACSLTTRTGTRLYRNRSWSNLSSMDEACA